VTEDENQPTGETDPDPATDPASDPVSGSDSSGPVTDADDDDYVDRLDGPGGMDALIAEFRAEQAAGKQRRQRPAWVPLFVMAVGAYLMFGLWSDALYAARSDGAVEELGHAKALFADGVPDGLHGRQVRLEGTPDVQHVARRKRKSGQTTGFMRLQEGGGSLFVAVPRRDGQNTLTYDGVFEGRMQRMSRVPGFESLRAYFDRDGILEILDGDRDAFAKALGPKGVPSIESEDGATKWTLSAEDEVRLVFRPAIANVQLGRGTWSDEAASDAVVAALGFPWRRAEEVDAELKPTDRAPFRSYQVAMPKGENDAVEARLNAAIPDDANRADPEVGALVLPTIFAYSVAPNEVRRVGADEVSLIYGSNMGDFGVRVADGKVVDRSLREGELSMPLADLDAVRVERPVKVDPNGYIVIVGERPSDQRVNGLLFLVVLGLFLANAAALGLILRRRSREA
jgi:hypothetical protein